MDAIKNAGKLTEASEQVGMPYRQAWGLLTVWSERMGKPLVTKEQGRGTRLTALGERLFNRSSIERRRVQRRRRPRKSRPSIAISTLRRLPEAGGPNLPPVSSSHAAALGAMPSSAAMTPSGRSSSAGQVFAQMRDGRIAGDEQDFGRAAQQPGKRDLHRRGTEAEDNAGQGR